MSDEPKGLYNKYNVTKTDGTPTDPEAQYFVLRIDNDKAARLALSTYGRAIVDENPALAKDIADKLLGLIIKDGQ